MLKKDKLNPLGVFIKKAMKGIECDWNLPEHSCFENAEWYIDGGNYCQTHAQDRHVPVKSFISQPLQTEQRQIGQNQRHRCAVYRTSDRGSHASPIGPRPSR